MTTELHDEIIRYLLHNLLINSRGFFRASALTASMRVLGPFTGLGGSIGRVSYMSGLVWNQKRDQKIGPTKM